MSCGWYHQPPMFETEWGNLDRVNEQTKVEHVFESHFAEAFISYNPVLICLLYRFFCAWHDHLEMEKKASPPQWCGAKQLSNKNCVSHRTQRDTDRSSGNVAFMLWKELLQIWSIKHDLQHKQCPTWRQPITKSWRFSSCVHRLHTRILDLSTDVTKPIK